MRPKFASPKVFLWIIHFRHSLLWCYNWYLRKFYGMKLAPDARISLKASHDFSTGRHSGSDAYGTRIGSRCFIGCASIIMPGVTIGDQCIVASGSVVTKNVPSHSIVAGNPAKVIRSGINTEPFGILVQNKQSEMNSDSAEKLNTKMAETA